jgi:hypothetical protein
MIEAQDVTPRSRSLSALRSALRSDASSVWLFAPDAAEALWLLPLVGTLVVAASRVDLGLFHLLTAEDRLLEWLQFAGFVAATVFAALAARLFARRGLKLVPSILLLLGIACVFIAGEEISWGQRIFGFDTPEELEELNKQGETTVHNIGPILTVFNFGMFCLGLYGSVVAGYLRTRFPKAQFRWRSDLLVPPLFLTSAFFVLFVYKGARMTFLPKNYTTNEMGEWAEFSLAFALAMVTYLLWRVARPQRR